MKVYKFKDKPITLNCEEEIYFLVGIVDLRPQGIADKKTYFLNSEIEDFQTEEIDGTTLYVLTCTREINYIKGKNSPDYRESGSNACEEKTSFWVN